MRTRVRAVATKLAELAANQLDPGMYLTDGERLYRVLAILETNVELEDCRDPDGLKQWLSVREVVRGMRLVRPGA